MALLSVILTAVVTFAVLQFCTPVRSWLIEQLNLFVSQQAIVEDPYVKLKFINLTVRKCDEKQTKFWSENLTWSLSKEGRSATGTREVALNHTHWGNIDRRFRGTCYFHHHRPVDGGRTYLWYVGRHSIKNTAVHPRRLWASIPESVRCVRSFIASCFFLSFSAFRLPARNTSHTCPDSLYQCPDVVSIHMSPKS
jgi:hypothetical protein